MTHSHLLLRRYVLLQGVMALIGVLALLFNPALGWGVVLLTLAAAGITAVDIAALLPTPIRPTWLKAVHGLVGGFLRSRFLILALLLPSALAVISLLGSGSLTKCVASLFFVVVWPWVTIGVLLTASDAQRHQARMFLIQLTAASLSLVLFAGLLELLLQVAFNALPLNLRHQLPQAPLRYGIQYATPHGAREYPAYEKVDLLITNRSGDLFSLTCLTPPPPTPESDYRVQYQRDEHGFRNPSPWPAASLVVVGDSFTAAESVTAPYWMGLAADTLNLGLSGSGSLEQLLLLRAYGLPRNPRVVVMAYFEGNDLTDTWLLAQARERGVTLYDLMRPHRPWEYLVTYQIAATLLKKPQPTKACHYPVMDAQQHPLTFTGQELTLSTIDAAALRDSALFQQTRSAILDAAHETQASGAVFVLAFIPHKAHVYWESLIAAGQITTFSGDTLVAEPTAEGLRFNESISDPAEIADYLVRNMDAQRQLLAELADEAGFLFLDFTPALQAASAGSDLLYFYGDTHWNQTGHDVARQALQAFLQAHHLLEVNT